MVCLHYSTNQPKAVNLAFLLIWWDFQARQYALFGSQAQLTLTWRKKHSPYRRITQAAHNCGREPGEAQAVALVGLGGLGRPSLPSDGYAGPLPPLLKLNSRGVRKVKAVFEKRGLWSNWSQWLTCYRPDGEKCSETRFLERKESVKVNREGSLKHLFCLFVFLFFLFKIPGM